MKTFTSLCASALLLAGSAQAAYRGFNLGGNMPNGACKTTNDFKADIAKIKSWPNGFNAVRLFASSDCGQLLAAVPAAQAYGFKILVGVWAYDNNHFGAEKAALLQAIKQYGTGWIAGISVGSEDLYRNTEQPKTPLSDPYNFANDLAGKIYDVRGMVRQYNKGLQVGHTDTWTAWVDGRNNAVTKAVDFVITDGYPYWQGSTIAASTNTFYASVASVKNYIASVHNVPVWIGETGWPTGGKPFGAATPGSSNALKYWKQVGCKLVKDNTNFFWFAAFDAPGATDEYGVESHFGVAYPGRTLKFKLNC